MGNSRGTAYSFDEDKHLCDVYINISKDPTALENHRKDHFWSCVTRTYNSTKPNAAIQERNLRSLQSRFQTIYQAVSKLKECLGQFECTNPSGASELDLLNRAKQMMRQDPKFTTAGFKFDHVWPVMKHCVRFSSSMQRQMQFNNLLLAQLDRVPESPLAPPLEASSFRDDRAPESPSAPPLEASSLRDDRALESPLAPPLESSSLRDEDVSGGSSSQPSEGGNSSKLKRKKGEGEDSSAFIRAIREENEKLRDENEKLQDLLMRRVENGERNLEMQKKTIELAQWKEDNKILMLNLDTICDVHVRECLRKEQLTIIQKRQISTFTRIY